MARDATRLYHYIRALDHHDWAFEFSDDPSQVSRGRESLRKVEAEAKEVDQDFAIWNDRCPPSHRRTE
jgi:hypothetical protein